MNKKFEQYTKEEIDYLLSVADKHDTLGKIADDFINHFGEKRTKAALCRKYVLIVTGKQIGRASCRERVSSPV